MYNSVTRFRCHFHSLLSLQVGRAYLFLFGKFLVPLSLSFLLSFSFLEKRFWDEDLVLGWDSAVMSVKVHGQLERQVPSGGGRRHFGRWWEENVGQDSK